MNERFSGRVAVKTEAPVEGGEMSVLTAYNKHTIKFVISNEKLIIYKLILRV